jgi:hypothetical protein
MTPTPHAPQVLSNDPDDFVQSGLYPGGQGIVNDISYAFWDYAGTRPPNSEVAVKLDFHPTDGSNEGKPVEIYWSVGPAAEFSPSGDGGFVFSIGSATGVRTSSNWAFVAVKLRDNCGLEKGKLNGPAGIKALIGSQLTLTRVDQPQREGLAPKMQQPGQQERKPTILIPTAAVFGWDKPGTRRPAAPRPATGKGPVAVPAMAAPASAPVPAAAPVPQPMPTVAAPARAAAPAPAQSNGAGPVDVDTVIAEVLAELLTQTEGNALEFVALPNSVLEKVGPQGRGVVVKQRMEITKQVKDPAYITQLAAAQGWAFDGTFLSLSA